MTACEICGNDAPEPVTRIVIERDGCCLTLEPVCQSCVDSILAPIPPWTGAGSLIKS